MSHFQIRRATRADLDIVSQHRASMFRDMGELPVEMFESFLAQSREVLHRMFKRNQYVGWLTSPQDEPGKIVAGAGVSLREVAPHPEADANGKIEIVSRSSDLSSRLKCDFAKANRSCRLRISNSD